MEYLDEDYKAIWSHIEYEEKRLKRKRRWLMGVPTTLKSGSKRPKSPITLKDMFLPESLIREDDVSYEIVRTSIERGFGASSGQQENYLVQDYLYLFETNELMPAIMKALPTILDDMNNIGLCSLGKIVAGSRVRFNETRQLLKKVISEHLPKVLKNPHHDYHKELLTQLPLLFKNPNNFQENRVTVNPIAVSYQSAVTQLLEGLEDMPTETLRAMHRKLRGLQVDIPKLQNKYGWTRGRLIRVVRQKCQYILSKLNEEGDLQQPLAKAMAIAALSLKLQEKSTHISVPEFRHFSPGTRALQNEILIAIWSFSEMNVKDIVVKELRGSLDPNHTIPLQHFQSAVRRLLTEYLFECNDMDIIPKQLLETLSVINRTSQMSPCFSKVEIEKEVECVLNLSSHIRQIVFNVVGNHNIDEEFDVAYMDDLQESDVDDQRLNATSLQYYCSVSSDDAESVGESKPDDLVLPTSDTNMYGSNLFSTPDKIYTNDCVEESQPKLMTDSFLKDPLESSPTSLPEASFQNETKNANSNQYLAIQEICDETSMVGYQIIGHLMEKFLQMKDVNLPWSVTSYLRGGQPNEKATPARRCKEDSCEENNDGPVLVQIIEDLIPDFPKRGLERAKILMGLK